MTIFKSFLQAVAQTHRELARQHNAQLRAANQAAREASRQADRARREFERAQLLSQKEKVRLHLELRNAQTVLQNSELEETLSRLTNLLAGSIGIDTFISFSQLKKVPQIPNFPPDPLAITKPAPLFEKYIPAAPTGLRRFIPGAKAKYSQGLAEAKRRYELDANAHAKREVFRQEHLAKVRVQYEQRVADIKAVVAAHNSGIDKFQQDFTATSPDAIATYFTMVLEASSYPDGFPQTCKIAYVRESKQLVMEYDLPQIEVVPEIASYKYVKSRDTIVSSNRPINQRRSMYSSVIAQLTLRTLHEVFTADRFGYLATIVFNGYVDIVDRGTGRPVRPCLVTVRTTRETFRQLDLSKVDPSACLRVLNASISKSPAELTPVRPVLEFSMVDPRFIEEVDILAGLDQRPNLMDLTPSEFESLITNLFEKMGLETRLTQASRDGGVDCVAFDARPIFGGKVVIQAKRYKNTVGVSAVRDLFGTVQNEGASKGILVTTSGYGQAAFEFAEGKPLELLSGSHLLYLLAEHANIEAKIEPPANWKDPEFDTPAEP